MAGDGVEICGRLLGHCCLLAWVGHVRSSAGVWVCWVLQVRGVLLGVDGVVAGGLLGLLLLLLLLVRVSLSVHLWLLHLWLLAGFYFEEGAHVGRRDGVDVL